MAASSMGDVLVEGRSAARSYGSGTAVVAAVTRATCKISKGDRIALVGPSGSGKSTLLYLLAGLERPSAGEIVWQRPDGTERLTPTSVGFAFQSPNLLPQLTAAENVAVPLLIAGVPPDGARRAAESMLARFDMFDVAERYAEDLSGGQAERVCLARALVAEPALVLADEPTGQLDGPTAAGVIDRMIETADRSGTAIVIATHDERIASRFPTRWTIRHGVLDVES